MRIDRVALSGPPPFVALLVVQRPYGFNGKQLPDGRVQLFDG